MLRPRSARIARIVGLVPTLGVVVLLFACGGNTETLPCGGPNPLGAPHRECLDAPVPDAGDRACPSRAEAHDAFQQMDDASQTEVETDGQRDWQMCCYTIRTAPFVGC
jgi:hypothetical protein